MPAGLTRRLLAVTVVLLVAGAMVHASSDIDPCLWTSTSHRSANHTSHSCQACNPGSWAAGPASLAIGPALQTFVLDLPVCTQWIPQDRAELSAPRAPPVDAA